ncbi:MAG: cytochrome c3 family protein, partial [Planctomycetota bacterium]
MRATAKTVSVLLILSLGACGIIEYLGFGEKPSRPFGHKVHAEEDLECETCHGEFAEAEKAGMPTLKKCMKCHEGIDEEKPPEKTLAVLYGEEPEWSDVTAIPEEVIFSHKSHHGKGVACGECHRGIEQSGGITEEVRVDKDACMSCHAEKGLSKGCSVCHKLLREDTPPASHRMNWRRVHGSVVRSGCDAPMDRCSMCHAESACVKCHQDEPPQNHNNFWRIQGHGALAAVDRGKCATCHRTDFCDRCHRETLPMTHTGGWGGTQNRHCRTCHGTRPTQRPCITCHLRSDHTTAAPRPANAQHAAATPAQCRTCHTTIGMPHVDNG